MIPIDTFFIFCTASVALALAPGPDNIFVLTQSALYGRQAGVLVTLGLCTGLLFHTSAVTLGVAAIFQTSELAFNALKIIGALYLVYLAWGAWRASASPIEATKETPLTAIQLYTRGIVMNITNPKVAIFFLAFLPQFTDPTMGAVSLQMILFGAVFIVTTFVVFGSVAWCAGFLGAWLQQSPNAQVIMNRVAGVIFVGLAVRLLLSER